LFGVKSYLKSLEHLPNEVKLSIHDITD
jgi:hypothetical protein